MANSQKQSSISVLRKRKVFWKNAENLQENTRAEEYLWMGASE